MSNQRSDGEAASLVMSRRPGPAPCARRPVMLPVRRSVRTRAEEATWGTWLVSATSASWIVGAMETGTAPTERHRAAARSAGDPGSNGPPTITVPPSKRSARAASIPDCSDPCKGWEATNRAEAPLPMAAVAAARTGSITLERSVSVAPAGIDARSRGTRDVAVLGGTAVTTRPASAPARSGSSSSASTAPRFTAPRAVSGSGSNPSTRGGSGRARRASPSDPPMSPSPWIATVRRVTAPGEDRRGAS